MSDKTRDAIAKRLARLADSRKPKKEPKKEPEPK